MRLGSTLFEKWRPMCFTHGNAFGFVKGRRNGGARTESSWRQVKVINCRLLIVDRNLKRKWLQWATRGRLGLKRGGSIFEGGDLRCLWSEAVAPRAVYSINRGITLGEKSRMPWGEGVFIRLKMCLLESWGCHAFDLDNKVIKLPTNYFKF